MDGDKSKLAVVHIVLVGTYIIILYSTVILMYIVYTEPLSKRVPTLQ